MTSSWRHALAVCLAISEMKGDPVNSTRTSPDARLSARSIYGETTAHLLRCILPFSEKEGERQGREHGAKREQFRAALYRDTLRIIKEDKKRGQLKISRREQCNLDQCERRRLNWYMCVGLLKIFAIRYPICDRVRLYQLRAHIYRA